ncbi:hypothetical protein SIO70_00770 [Chitinophaga sancti]|uniref:hypothetical protein n=1 Tax=Chitinophaga sancti TaxID=1004 RepID=UPI002A74F0A2|nr:hypothetical protein [Chitinophaga sancti]WPQ63394.1 hypothetical protein SIO70_00770 [Chitinophaga sancti]
MNPMKNRIKNLLSIFAFAVTIIVTLHIYAKIDTFKSNNFNRLILNNAISEEKNWQLAGNTWQISGISGDDIYLGNRKYLNLLMKCNIPKNDTHFIQIKLDQADTMHFNNASLYINDTSFFLVDGNLRKIYKGDVGKWEAHLLQADRSTFDLALPISNNTFTYRLLNRQDGFELAKKSFDKDSFTQVNGLLQKQLDGVFCKDGQLLYDPYESKIIYTYLYRNEFIVADSNLHLLYRGHTLDTTVHAKLKLSNRRENGVVTIEAPPLIVSRKSCVSHGLLFINSGLKADNENREDFSHSSVVDIYDLKNGKYLSSFYIPYENDVKFKDFRVNGDQVIALYDHALKIYQLHLPGINLKS